MADFYFVPRGTVYVIISEMPQGLREHSKFPENLLRGSEATEGGGGGEGVGGECPPSHGVELFCFSMWNCVFWCILQRVFSHISTHYFCV